MKCPHCRVEIHPDFSETPIGAGVGVGGEPAIGGGRYPTFFTVRHMVCPACGRAILSLMGFAGSKSNVSSSVFIHPRRATRAPAPADVPVDLAKDFNEAGVVLEDSPQSSTALSRRCLQALLALQGFDHHNLAGAIDAVLEAKALRSELADDLDTIRKIGNFAAHPMKDTNSGEILPVEPHEAEWNLDVLEGLFDFYYVAPAKAAAKRTALNAKLQAGGQGPVKTP